MPQIAPHARLSQNPIFEVARAVRCSPRAMSALSGLGALALGALGGWTGFIKETPGLTERLVPYGFQAAIVTLLMGVLLLRRRWHGVALLFGWYAAALSPLPWIWGRYFGVGWLVDGGSLVGLLVLVGAAALQSLPAMLVTNRIFRVVPGAGVLVAMVLGALPPFALGSFTVAGPSLLAMGSPWLAAGALLPGVGGAAHGWIAIALLATLIACMGVVRAEGRIGKLVTIAALVLIGASGVMAVRGNGPGDLPLPAGAPSRDVAWGMTVATGEVPDPDSALDRYETFEDRLQTQIRDALNAGARFIVTPEGMAPKWTPLEELRWASVAALARAKHATVLLGVYAPMPRSGALSLPSDWANGLRDIATGQFYPNHLSQPITMWRPWAARQVGSFPIQTESVLVRTPYGTAGLLICYEQLLPWPLMKAMRPWARVRPALLIATANEWFIRDDRDWLGRTQHRAAIMQSYLWNLPLILAVNVAAPTFEAGQREAGGSIRDADMEAP